MNNPLMKSTDKSLITNDTLMEGMDKAAFLRWMRAESMCVPQTDIEVNAICQRWIKHKIRRAIPVAKKYVRE